MARIPWRESLSARLAVSMGRPSAAATDKVCRETVWCLRLGRNFLLRAIARLAVDRSTSGGW
jgi:hypothetical protein